MTLDMFAIGSDLAITNTYILPMAAESTEAAAISWAAVGAAVPRHGSLDTHDHVLYVQVGVTMARVRHTKGAFGDCRILSMWVPMGHLKTSYGMPTIVNMFGEDGGVIFSTEVMYHEVQTLRAVLKDATPSTCVCVVAYACGAKVFMMIDAPK